MARLTSGLLKEVLFGSSRLLPKTLLTGPSKDLVNDLVFDFNVYAEVETKNEALIKQLGPDDQGPLKAFHPPGHRDHTRQGMHPGQRRARTRGQHLHATRDFDLEASNDENTTRQGARGRLSREGAGQDTFYAWSGSLWPIARNCCNLGRE